MAFLIRAIVSWSVIDDAIRRYCSSFLSSSTHFSHMTATAFARVSCPWLRRLGVAFVHDRLVKSDQRQTQRGAHQSSAFARCEPSAARFDGRLLQRRID